MIACLNKARKSKNDVFYTPDDLADDCISMIDIAENDFLLDPFYGQGAFYNKFPANNPKDWCEIEMGRDFFEYTDKVDWIISNPPFSKMSKVLNHCAKICRKGFGLVMSCLHLLPNRFNKLEEKGFVPTKVHLFKVAAWNGFPHFFVVFEKRGDSILRVDTIFAMKPFMYSP